MTTPVRSQLTPEKAKLVQRVLVFAGAVMVIVGLILFLTNQFSIVGSVLILAGLLDMLLGLIVFPKIVEKTNSHNESKPM